MPRSLRIDQSLQNVDLSDEAMNHHGAYHAQTGLKHSDGVRGGWLYPSPNPLAHDQAVQDRLWKVSEELVSELKF